MALSFLLRSAINRYCKQALRGNTLFLAQGDCPSAAAAFGVNVKVPLRKRLFLNSQRRFERMIRNWDIYGIEGGDLELGYLWNRRG